VRLGFRRAGRLAATLSMLLYRLNLPDRPSWPSDRPLLIAVNHRSLLDSVVGFHAFLRWDMEPHFLVHQRYFAHPVLRRLLESTGCVPAAGDSSSLDLMRTVRELMLDGRHVLIMPEGRVVRPHDWIDGMGRAERGVAAIVRMTRPMVMAVGMIGTDDVWHPDQPRPRIRLGKARPEVVITVEMLDPDPTEGPERILATIESAMRQLIARSAARRLPPSD
jgi:1-acyl-sn-glycerol-3-phosphate acyltransferase